MPNHARASDRASLLRLFGDAPDLLPLWIAEPYVDLAPSITEAMRVRAASGWYGYETRPDEVVASFWEWTETRHGWAEAGLQSMVSPSIGTSIGVLIDLLTNPGDSVILQPPVYSGFKPIVARAGRKVVRNSLVLAGGRYGMDLVGLASKAADPDTKMMILCNPHNPVGRVWSAEELAAAARICGENRVFVIADEIHADIALAPATFLPFADAVGDSGVRWAAAHGPIKTFGLAGVCDSLVVTDDEEVAESFRDVSSRFHLTRNNVFGIAAFETAYRTGAEWLDGFLGLVAANVAQLRDGLPAGIDLIEPDATYLAWLDFRQLGMDVPELTKWLPKSAHLALSPGHWFGREGAGFARMTIAAPQQMTSRPRTSCSLCRS